MRRALLVGIDDYRIGPLAGCVNDVTALRPLLERHDDGSPNFETRTLISTERVVDRFTLRDGVRQLFDSEAELAFFYFAGHGSDNDLGGYLVSQEVSTFGDGMPMGDLLTLANSSPVREIVITLDCCRSGRMGEVPAINNTYANIREGISILTASRANEDAIELGGHGLFSSLLVDALEGGAAELLGSVTVPSAYAYIDQSLGAWDPRPLFKAHLSTLVPIRKCEPAIAHDTLRRLPEFFPDPFDHLELDPTYEPTLEPSHPVHEAVFRALQECQSAKVVEPVGAEYMYFAARDSASCRLTARGRHYWRLARAGRV